MENIKISVIIPTLNRVESLKRTINNYIIADDIPDEIIIVDQSDNENYILEIQEYLSQVKVCSMIYHYQKYKSSTMARNYGIKKASGNIIVFSDDDIDVKLDTIRNLRMIFTNDEIAMVAGIDDLADKSNSKIGYLLGTKSFSKRNIGHVTKSMLGRYPNEINENTDTEWAMGYFFAVRKYILQEMNLYFDENLTYYAYAEDLDFSYSYYKYCLNKNMKCILSPKVIVSHLVSKEYRITNTQQLYVYIINREYLGYKHRKSKLYIIPIFWTSLLHGFRLLLSKGNYKYYFKILYLSIKKLKYIEAGNLFVD